MGSSLNKNDEHFLFQESSKLMENKEGLHGKQNTYTAAQYF
jgi:hypothetical protein